MDKARNGAKPLFVMVPGRDYSRAELLVATDISETDGTWTIRRLKEAGRVMQAEEIRGALHALNIPHRGGGDGGR